MLWAFVRAYQLASETMACNMMCEDAGEGIDAFVAKRNRGLNSAFIVRKISSGEGVERTFQTYSPLVAGIEVKRRGDVRRAKLYYLRQRSGKSARIKEKLDYKAAAAKRAAQQQG